jgi:hypothetical protein
MAEIDLADATQSHARRVLMHDRRPDLYLGWLSAEPKAMKGSDGV